MVCAGELTMLRFSSPSITRGHATVNMWDSAAEHVVVLDNNAPWHRLHYAQPTP
jgi:hypothetical protein